MNEFGRIYLQIDVNNVQLITFNDHLFLINEY